jgi:hypothetical protein
MKQKKLQLKEKLKDFIRVLKKEKMEVKDVKVEKLSVIVNNCILGKKYN